MPPCFERVFIHSYHSRVPQVEGVPAEALWEAVGLLSNVVFVGFNGTVRRHRLPWGKSEQFLTWSTDTWIPDILIPLVGFWVLVKNWQMSYLAWAQVAYPRTGNSSELPPPWFWQGRGLQRTVQWPFESLVAYRLAMNSPVRKVKRSQYKAKTLKHSHKGQLTKYIIIFYTKTLLSELWGVSFKRSYGIHALERVSWAASVGPVFFFFFCFFFFFLAPVSSARPLSLKRDRNRRCLY